MATYIWIAQDNARKDHLLAPLVHQNGISWELINSFPVLSDNDFIHTCEVAI
ncbi:MAG: hypothetical protein GY694_16545 [Gammaproteobacteria bacterium]|nr:hypothetical protein [Gammaproteobacteria bacterium]